MITAAWEVAYYGTQPRSVKGFPFASIEEEIIGVELTRRAIPYVAQWRPYGGDIPFTPNREQRSGDFYLPALQIVLNPTSAFTHPDPAEDALNRQLFLMLGVETYFIPDYEIVPAMGGDVRVALDKIPGLAFYGENRPRKSGYRHFKRFAQLPRERPGGGFH